jgi:internalin A
MPKVQFVCLKENKMASLAPFTHLSFLSELCLSHNAFKGDLSLAPLSPSLTRLDLSHNALSSLSSLSHLTRLSELNLLDNHLTVVPFRDLTALKILSVSHNCISDIYTLLHLKVYYSTM